MDMQDLLAPPVWESVHVFRARRAAETGMFYSGPHWYAHVCHALRVHDGETTLGGLGLSVSALDRGVGGYASGEPAHVRLLGWGGCTGQRLEAALRRTDAAAPDSFSEAFRYEGLLEGAVPACSPEEEAAMSRAAVADLLARDTLTVRFHTPLRVRVGHVRREHQRQGGRFRKAPVFMDERCFSLSRLLRACWARLCAMSGRPFTDPESPAFSGMYRLAPGEAPWLASVPLPPDCDALLRESNLMWLRSPYSKSGRDAKDIGGLLGEARLFAGLPPFWLHCLLLAGRRHAGLFPAFGFGRIEVAEASGRYEPGAWTAPVSLLERAASPHRLREAGARLGGRAADIEGATPADVAYARPEWFESLRARILSEGYAPAPMKPYRVSKKGSSDAAREILVPAVADRVLHRAVHDVLAPSVDAFLSSASFAYRRGLNREGAVRALESARKDGYTRMIKADIEAFFDRLSWPLIEARLRLLYGDDPVASLIMAWVRAPVQRAAGPAPRVRGLPQGMALSPLLANLVLDVLDAELERRQFRLVRFCDDFIVLTRSEAEEGAALERVREVLAALGLRLREDKTSPLAPGEEFNFLGYRLVAGDPEAATAPSPDHDPEPGPSWSLFTAASLQRRTVYLGGRIRGARCHKDRLVFVDREYREAGGMPWKEVARIIASGRVNMTGAVQRAALQKGVPILYLNLWGQCLGETVPAFHPRPGLAAAQYALAMHPERRLQWVRDTVSARLHNMHVVMRRHEVDTAPVRALLARAAAAETVEEARGFEGAAARWYWGHFGALVAPFSFPGRHYHPPPDPVNAMLSLLYTLLHHRVASLLRVHGFDPARGFFHEPRSGHAALASDMMEEFRHFMELIVLRVVRQRRISPDAFAGRETGGGAPCVLSDDAFRLVLGSFETRMQKAFTGRGKRCMSLAEWLEEQVRDLRAALLLGQSRTPLRSD